MKKFKYFGALFIFLIVNCSIAQSFYYQTRVWAKTPTVYKPAESEKKQDIVIVFEWNSYEVAYDADGQAAIYETMHVLYHVNNQKGVDEVNKGYMSMRNVIEEIDLNARSISSENKITYLNRSTVKSVDNFENAGAYKIFAIDGVEPNCDVEIKYTNKKQYYSYSYNVASSNYRTLDFETHIVAPKNLFYDIKCYNGLNNFVKDTSLADKNHWVLKQGSLERNKKEKYSASKANKPAFMFQLAYNTDKTKAKIYSWETISKEYYNSLFVEEDLNLKSLKKLLESNKILTQETTEKKIRELESYIKTNFEISNNFKNSDLAKSISKKKISELNALRLFVASFKIMSIGFEIALTTDRDQFRFDPKMPSYMYVNEYVIYFPEIDKYMSPLEFSSRLGFPNPYVLNNEGLFIKEVSIGDISTASSKVKTLKTLDVKSSYHNYEVKANVNLTSNTLQLDITQKLAGYSAYYLQPVYRFLNDEQKLETRKAYYLSEDVSTIKNAQVLNTDEKDLFVNPLIIKYSVEQNDYLEAAGTKYFLKVGLFIGKQEELYQEDVRINPAETGYPHFMNRELTINIPAGYKATNLEELVIKKVCTIGGAEAATFSSNYQVKGDQIIVTVYEDYKRVDYPLTSFNEFKEVINAAADFNKRNIVFEKQ